MPLMNIVGKVLRVGEGKRMREYEERAAQVTELRDAVHKLSDDELRAKTDEFRSRLAEGETLDEILPEAFACVREAARRTLGMEHFDVQLIGGMVLHEGKIAEMKTGEGKTLAATLPVYLNTLEGKGVHIVTVNDYLARRDAEWMGPIYRALGLQAGVIQAMMDFDERREAYLADVTYGTNSEFGFDYLRDNLGMSAEQQVQRGHNYAIVDEVDSILIDEARTPLIISGMVEDASVGLYSRLDEVVSRMRAKILPHAPKTQQEKDESVEFEETCDYIVFEDERTAKETTHGQEKLARAFGYDSDDLFGGEPEQENKLPFDEVKRRHDIKSIFKQSMVAHSLYQKDKEYVVRDGADGKEVMIVDEFTGRLMEGRRYSEGLHQAIEAKEKVRIQEENQTLATITLQNYFRMYEKLAGMTGTAMTEEEEFRHIYKLDTVAIRTNAQMIRGDMPDLIYKTGETKFNAVVEDIVERQEAGQPVLVGTIAVEKSEVLSNLLRKRGVKHEVLNAKNHTREGLIIAQAGRIGAVTIATNMAGRGVDIMLGGDPRAVAMEKAGAEDLKDFDERFTEEERNAAIAEAKRITEPEHEKVVGLGGLHVVGTERHESRRIDNQLRGRCGRQGDPGSSQFYLSLEDDLMRLFGSHRIGAVMERLQWPEDMPIEHGMITKSVETAQKQLESQNFAIRKQVLEYDDVINRQREQVYSDRHKIVSGEELSDLVGQAFAEVTEGMVQAFTAQGRLPEEWDLDGLVAQANELFPLPWGTGDLDLQDLTREELSDRLLESVREAYAKREEELGAELLRDLERMILLQVIDRRWLEHMHEMDRLREGIGLRAVAQLDPLVEYTKAAFTGFEEMIAQVKEDFIDFIFRVQVAVEPEPPAVAMAEGGGQAFGGPAGGSAGGGRQSAGPSGKSKKHPKAAKGIGRNDPCPCGSGKKYKKCCGA